MRKNIDDVRKEFKERERSGHNKGGRTPIGNKISIKCGCGDYQGTDITQHWNASPNHKKRQEHLERIKKRQEYMRTLRSQRAERRRRR